VVNHSKKVPDLDCEVQDLLEVVDLEQEMPDPVGSLPPQFNPWWRRDLSGQQQLQS